MPKYIAFLRAINVGGHTVKMDHLRSLFETMGFAQVETFIASGNVIFDSPNLNSQALESQIEATLHKALGYAVATFIRSTAELAAVANHQPFADKALNDKDSGLYVSFTATAPDAAAQQKLLAFTSSIDSFHIHGREVYWLCRIKISESTFSGKMLEKAIGMPATMRNISTVKKLAAKYL